VTGLRLGAVAVAMLAVGVAGCGGGGGSKTSSATTPKPTGTTLGLSSTAFVDGASIPKRYTCDGEGASPPLTWTRVPSRAHSLALMVEDPDAPGGTFTHWSVWDMPRGSAGTAPGKVPPGSVQGANSGGQTGYTGPCPPPGDSAHHYVFRIYALDDDLGLKSGASPDAVRAAIGQHAIATGTLTGRYRR
jgi:Raf kinase inhibitor-like YbhB/YbcL family protein